MTMVTPCSADAADELDAIAGFGRREARERLVEEQKLRLRRERARDLEPALLGRGERDGRRVGAREKSGELERLERLLPRLARARMTHQGADDDVLDDRHRIEAAHHLEGARDAEGAAGGRGEPRDLLSGEDDASRGRRIEPGDRG